MSTPLPRAGWPDPSSATTNRAIGGSTPRPMPPATAVLVMLLALAALWLSELVDQLSGNRLDNYGIHARELDGLPEIYSAPLLHGGWDHLIANSGPFFVLGLLVLLGGAVRWAVSTIVSVTVSGLTAWLLTPVNTIILGASGLIFGWLSYLLVRGLLTRRPAQVIIGIVVLVVYGGMIWGVLPGAAGISWQAHLGGAIGGVLAAWLLHRRRGGAGRSTQSAPQARRP
jgi:membrane associated rhomboid family serine protease